MRILCVGLLALLPLPTIAQSFTHKASAFSLGAYQLDGQGLLSDFNFDGIFLSARSDYALSPTFGLQGNLNFDRMDSPGGTYDTTVIGLHSYYELSGGNRVGAFLQRRHVTFSGTANDLTNDSFGAEVLWNLSPRFAVEAYVGIGELEAGNGNTFDSDLWGIRADYDITEALRVHLSLDEETVSSGMGSSATYTDSRIGVDYAFETGGSGVPLTVGLEYGQYDLGFADPFERYVLSVKIPLDPTGSRPARKMFHDRGGLTNILPIN
jgi:hypothetical protein